MPKNFVSYDNAEDLMTGIDNKKVSKIDLTSIIATGTTNTTGSVIESGKYFYLNNSVMKAIDDIGINETFVENTNYITIPDGTLNENSSTGGGHTIQDASGNDMPQESDLQFAGYLKTTDDSSGGKTVVSDAPTEITYDDYMAMTPAQKQGTKWLITDAPGHLATNQAIFTLKDQELTFTGTTATISDQRINTSTYPLIYWDDSSIEAAAEAHITSTVSNGQITFTAETAPASTLTCDIVFISNAYSGGGSGGGGHVIIDNTGEELPQESNLQFADAEVTDDSTNSKTVVKVVRQMTQAEFDELSQSEKAGVIEVTDANAPQMLASQIKASDGNNLNSLVVPYVVDFDVWNAYDEEERSALKAAHPKIHVTNVPGADGSIDIEMFTKLWENPSPTSVFAAQNITLASGDYDFLLVVSNLYTSMGERFSVISPKGSNIYINYAVSGSGSRSANRTLTYVNDTTLTAEDAYTAIGTTQSSVDNARCIPIAIYGIKSTVSLKISAIASNVSTSASKCMMPDGVTPITDAIKWKAHALNQTVTNDGTSKVTLPTEFNELLVLIRSSGTVYGRYNLSALELSSNPELERSCGWYEGANYNSDVLFYKSKSQIYGAVRLKGTIVATTADVYYR